MVRSSWSPILRGAIAAIVAPVCVAASAAAQESPLPEAVAAAVRPVFDDARSRGLPVEALMDKAREGAAKGVPADRIRAVVEQLSARLDRARGLLAGDPAAQPPAPADIGAVADALRRGVPEEAVRTIRADAAPEQPVALAVHTLADLLQREVPVDAALDVLRAWTGRRGDADALRALPAAVERLIRQGVLPERAAASVAAAVRAGRPPAAAGRPPNAGPPGMVPRGPPVQPPIPPGAGPPDGKGGDPPGGDSGGG